MIQFRFSEKATKIWWKSLNWFDVKFKLTERFRQILGAFSKYLNFIQENAIFVHVQGQKCPCGDWMYLMFISKHQVKEYVLLILYRFIFQRKTRSAVDIKGTYTLVHLFNNRWRWCCGRFNLRQRTVELGYQKKFFNQGFFDKLGFGIFQQFKVDQNQIFVEFSRSYRITFNIICRMYILK